MSENITNNTMVLPTLEEFDATFEDLLKELLHENIHRGATSSAITRFEEMMRCTVPEGSAHRGYPVLRAYTLLCKESADIAENTFLSFKLAWAWQIMIGFMIFMDDIIDGDAKRFSRPTWIELQKKSKFIPLDLSNLCQSMYQLLNRHFQNKAYYGRLIGYYTTAIQKYSIGQNIDGMSFSEITEGFKISYPDLLTKYEEIVKLIYIVPAMGVFHTPLIAHDFREDTKSWKGVITTCNTLGQIVAISDSLSDCFGITRTNRNCQEDIKNGRVRWLVLKVKELGTAEQWAVIKDAYGKSDEDSVRTVISIFHDLKLQEIGQGEIKTLKKKLEADCKQLVDEGETVGSVIKDLLDGVFSSKEW